MTSEIAIGTASKMAWHGQRKKGESGPRMCAQLYLLLETDEFKLCCGFPIQIVFMPSKKYIATTSSNSVKKSRKKP
ncbi:MAG: hypothetical protein ACRD5J_00345 [Nitrososphaeraceae archaeon]